MSCSISRADIPEPGIAILAAVGHVKPQGVEGGDRWRRSSEFENGECLLRQAPFT